MTDHGIHPWYQRATFRHWSDIVLTVSAGTRENLAGPFGVSPDRVVVGFSGVDTGQFRPDIDASDLRAQWGVPGDHPLIVNVSRFSHRKARPALSLIEALPLIREEEPNTSAVLVGGGPWWGRIEEQAQRLNKMMAARVVNPVGPRTDIPRVMNAADVSLSAATTAVEALACGTPTIAYGYSGYFGVIEPGNLEAARSAGFGDHGNLPPRPPVRRLAEDLLSLLRDLPAARARAGEVRGIIVERYSLEKMVDQIEGVYRDLGTRNSRIG
jgi:phosphatidylinositol alpha-1,6-mannosyltransferase